MLRRPDPHRETIRSRRNRRVLDARRIAHDTREARREGLLLADGTRLVREALRAGLEPRVVFVDPNDPDRVAIDAEADLRRFRMTLASTSVIEAVSTLKSPQGAVGLFVRPCPEPKTILGGADRARPPIVAVLHGLQDPTNAGSIIRTAMAAGLSGILATEGTVDLFHPRSVRASMGATFHLPLATDLAPARLWETLQRGRYRILALDPRGETPLSGLQRDTATAILLGREGCGLDAATRKICHASIMIPMAEGVESLGVAAAGAIAFYALASAVTD